MNDNNVHIQSPNVESGPREVLNESNFPLAAELKRLPFRKAVRSVNCRVHRDMSLRRDAEVSFFFNILYTAPHGDVWVVTFFNHGRTCFSILLDGSYSALTQSQGNPHVAFV